MRDLFRRRFVRSPLPGKGRISSAKCSATSAAYTNIRGGWAYPGLVRKTKDNPKPIKVYLQDGKDDLNNLHGNWPLGNQDLAAALQFAGYHYRLVMTEGGHSGKWGGAATAGRTPLALVGECESTKIPSTQSKPAWEPHSRRRCER